MSQQIKHIYEFGPFRLDAGEQLLLRDGEAVQLTPKAFALLLLLVERHGHLLPKDELLKLVWPDSFVEEANLASNISQLRKALGERENGHRYIETVPKRGYRFVAEVREALPTTAEALPRQKAGPVADVPAAVPALSPPSQAGRRARTMIVFALALLIGTAAMGIIALRRPPHLPLPKTMPFTTLPGRESDMTFSPDGNQLVFTWDGGGKDSVLHLYVKQVGSEAVRQLTSGPGTELSPSWSPDGREIAFIRWSAKGRSLHVIPALGGAERKINDHVFYFSARIAWTPDGQGLVIQGNHSADEPRSLYFVVRETGEMRKLTTPPDGIYGDRFPALSPDGQMIVFCRAASISQSELYSLPVSGGEPKQLTFDQATTKWPVWTPDGREIIFVSNRRDGSGSAGTRLWRISATGGELRPVETAGRNPDAPAISKQGDRLAWAEDVRDFNIWQIELDAGQKQPPRLLLSSTQWEDSPQFSPDGSKIVFASDRSGSTEIWVCDSNGGNLLQLTDSAKNGSPRWSPDSRQIVYDSLAEGNAEIYVIGAEGGSPRRLTSDPAEDIAPSWSRDGRWVYFCSNRGGGQQIWKMPAAGGPAVQVTKYGGFDNIESPDGRYLYYLKGRLMPGIWRVPTAGGEETLVTDHRRAGYWRHWAVTEAGIYFATAEQTNDRPLIEFFSFATGQIKPVVALEKPIYPTPPGLAVSPDGRRLIWSQLDHVGSDIMLMENFR
jgi:Tol biopolymer transport system component/DNA-binding winged helix-turn-helix (wHTH) protein